MAEQLLKIQKIQGKKVTVHSCASPDDGERVNSQVLEFPESVVVVDTLLMRPYAQELRRYVDGLGKPIAKVIATHAHPDHWFGLESFEDAPTAALPETSQEITYVAKTSIDLHRSQHGDKITDRMILPKEALAEGNLTIDGVGLRLHKFADAEDLFMLAIDIPEERIFVAQDLIYMGVHIFVGQKTLQGKYCFEGWMGALERFRKESYDVVLPGHGAPSDGRAIEQNLKDLATMKTIVESSTAQDFVQRTFQAFPDRGLPSMVYMTEFCLFKMGM